MSDVSQILSAIDAGDPKPAEKLLPLVYDELCTMAARKMAHESPGQTLDATALVHEAYLRLVDSKNVQQWNSLGHFFAAAAETMRRILVEKAGHKCSLKAGGEFQRRDLADHEPARADPDDELLDINGALAKLEAQDQWKANVVKLRFFADLTIDETAVVLGIAKATANNDWAFARSWLRVEVEAMRNK